MLAFPDTDDSLAQPEATYCALPIRPIGFSFPIHYGAWELAANREDLRYAISASSHNQRICDEIPDVFAAATQTKDDLGRKSPLAYRIAADRFVLAALLKFLCAVTAFCVLR